MHCFLLFLQPRRVFFFLHTIQQREQKIYENYLLASHALLVKDFRKSFVSLTRDGIVQYGDDRKHQIHN